MNISTSDQPIVMAFTRIHVLAAPIVADLFRAEQEYMYDIEREEMFYHSFLFSKKQCLLVEPESNVFGSNEKEYILVEHEKRLRVEATEMFSG